MITEGAIEGLELTLDHTRVANGLHCFIISHLSRLLLLASLGR